MRHRPLHTALAAFAEEAAFQLAADTAQGAVLAFDVVELPPPAAVRRDTPLYCYRPLTDGFIRDRVGVLGQAPTYPAAAKALAALDGLEDYLRAQGEPRVPIDGRERADAALRVFISRVFSDATEFVLTPARFERAYAELEAAALDGRAQATVVAPISGLDLVSPEIALGEGLALVRGEDLDDAPGAAVWPEGAQVPRVLACLTVTESDPAHPAPAPLVEGRIRFARLISALRLFDESRVALDPVAWVRTGAGPWTMAMLGTTGRSYGTLLVDEDAEDELRAFCSLVARRTPRAGELAWALRRFEMGCERPTTSEALTDHLLALRALLEPEGPASGRLAGRVAALCATEADRVRVNARMAHAISLERSIVAGVAVADAGVDALILELAGHLRALLRDVLCGHLDADLRAVADALLAEAGSTSIANG